MGKSTNSGQILQTVPISYARLLATLEVYLSQTFDSQTVYCLACNVVVCDDVMIRPASHGGVSR